MKDNIREAMALHLWDEGLVRPESLAFSVVDALIAEGLRDTTEIRTVIEEVCAVHEGRISTHYEDCWKYHAGCLASLLLSILEGGRVNWTRNDASGFARTAMQLGLTPEDSHLALVLGSRLISHGLNGSDLDHMILWWYESQPTVPWWQKEAGGVE